MGNQHYVICTGCNGKGSIEREVRVSTMNSGGFAFIDIECSECSGEGEVERPEVFPLESPVLRSLRDVASELEELEAELEVV